MNATRWAQTLLRALVAHGVRRAVVSPGSRSTPLAHAAATTVGLSVQSIIDERSAGFFALGQVRVTGEPTLLIATSGSAAAHYFPAILEAKHAGLPLIVLTADRPFELQRGGASQTTDQLHMFGGSTRGFFELGAPDDAESALLGLERVAARAVRIAVGEGGVVHLNARFRKPFDPVAEEAWAPARPAVAAWARSLRVPAASVLEPLLLRLSAAERPIIVLGPLSPGESPAPERLGAWARRLGAPVLAEASSQLRFADLGPEVVRADRFDLYLDLPGVFEGVPPDLVVELGRSPTSRAYAAFLERHPGMARVVISPAEDCDPGGSASWVIRADLAPTLEALSAGAPSTPKASSWAARLGAWESKVDVALRELGAERGVFGELEVVQTLHRALPDHSILMVGNSLPVRHVDRWLKADGRSFTVLSQRGLSGIDGLISGAAGSADASGRPLALLVGDVSFLHDLGGLLAARLVRTPLVFVVLHNDGGRIFEELPIATNPHAAPHQALWTTPHGVGLGGVAESFGLPHALVTSAAELELALRGGFAHPGPSIVEARVPPSDAERTWRGVRERLARGLFP